MTLPMMVMRNKVGPLPVAVDLGGNDWQSPHSQAPMRRKHLYHRGGAADGEAAQGGASPRRLAATAGGRLGRQ
jgi:hypothetical protein